MSPILDIRIPPRRGLSRKALSNRGRKPKPRQKTASRFLLDPLYGKPASMPAFDHKAIVEGRTKYPATVREARRTDTVLKSGRHQSKIGGVIRKGKWADMPVFCLTLEERATCPAECPLWRACYGNNMHQAHRFAPGAMLEERIAIEVAIKAAQFPRGFAVRLHVLGDFYSVRYVKLWAALLREYPELHVFGFTARWRREDPVAVALIELAMENWERFAMRFSNAPIDTGSTVTIEHEGQKPHDAVICPAQLGKTESCSTCGLCWQTNRRIAFIRH